MFRTSFNELTTLTLSNGEIAMLGGFTTFIVPLDSEGNKYSRLLEWRDTRDLQWGILIMFGGGLALAKAFSDAGIIYRRFYDRKRLFTFYFGQFFGFNHDIDDNSHEQCCVGSGIRTNPSGDISGANVNFIDIGIPLALASRCAFMLPMSTPPNAIVYTGGIIQVKHMLKVGFLLNIVSTLLLIAMSLLMIHYL
jgi:solute carrier family 13 (sodium-dependent dicarboxylate transporter), member 2/3/5